MNLSVSDSPGSDSEVAHLRVVQKQLSPLQYWGLAGLILVAALWLHRDVLNGTLISDDWDHYAMVQGIYPAHRAPWQLFEFVRADRSDYRALLASGRLPWWTDPDLQISFLRPLASVLTYADFVWLGAREHPGRAHLHSLVWWGACLLVTAGLLRTILPGWLAVCTFLIFALDDAHALPVAWSASRAELISHTLMLAAIWAYLAALEGQRRGLRWIASGMVWLAFAAGEHALSMFAYVVALTLFGPVANWRERWRGLMPLWLPLLVYVVTHAALGYGTRGSSFYTDPIAEPLAYWTEFRVRAPLLLGDALLGYTSDWWFLLPRWALLAIERGWLPAQWVSSGWLMRFQLILGYVAVLLLILMIWRLRRFRSDRAPAALRWLSIGALGSVPPLCSAFAMSRLTVAPALGIDAILAWALISAVQQVRSAGSAVSRSAAGLLVCAILAVHVVLAAQRSAHYSELYAAWSRSETSWLQRSQLDVPALDQRHVIVVSANDLATQFCLPYVLHFQQRSMPASSQIMLPPALAPLEMRRIAENALELRSSVPGGLSGFRNSAYRRESTDFTEGQRIAAARFDVEVQAVERGVPTALRFVFARSLDDPSYLFMYPRPGGLQRLDLPALGENVQLPPPAAPIPEPVPSGA